MLSEKEYFRPEYLIEIATRRKGYLIIPLTIAMIVGIYLSITLPKVYRSSTLILVQPQKVPTSYVQSIVTSSVESRLRTISEQIMSITNIERIIRNFNLFIEPRYKDMYWEDKINEVRNRISLSVSKGNTFSVSFTGKDPKTVMEVANALASYFIDENLKVREAQAVSTSAFLDDELTGVKTKLHATERMLMEFRKSKMGSLPEQLESNLKILERLHSELNDKENRIMTIQEGLLRLETHRKEYLNGNLDVQNNDIKIEKENEEENIIALKNQYKALKSKYTDKHPDVVKIRKMIETFGDNNIVEKTETTNSDGILVRIDQKRNDGEKDLIRTKKQIKEIEKQIIEYQKRIEETPYTEQKFVDINRNYDNVKSQYNSLLERKLESEIAVNMEKKQKGEQFKIVDPAKLPEKPYEPNLNMLFFLFIGAGLGLGVGLISLMEYFDTAFRRAEEVEPYLKIPVLAYVPTIKTKVELRNQRIRKILSIIPITGAAMLFGLFTISTITADENTIMLLEKMGVIKVINIIDELLRTI